MHFLYHVQVSVQCLSWKDARVAGHDILLCVLEERDAEGAWDPTCPSVGEAF